MFTTRVLARHPASLMFASIFLLLGCQAGEPPAPVKRIVLVQAAAPASAGATTYTGDIRARHEIDLAFRVGGKITERLVDIGAEVRPGQPLARLDPADLELAAAASRAQLSAAETDFATAQAERERYAGLLRQKFVSQAAFDSKHNAYQGAQARLEQARSQSRITANQANYGTLSSAFPAIVTAVLADAGQVVSAGQAVFRLARPEEKEVAIAIPESRLAELKAAKHVAVNLWADPKVTVRGELRELAPAADPASRTYAARIRLLQPPPDIRLGMTARVTLDSAGESSLLVPLGAVIDQGKGPLVWVVTEGKVQRRAVSLAGFREDGAAIAEGLQAGEQVVISGAARLVAGEAVEARLATPAARQR
jgi:RND family efflux transporter MFP subunit